ncbi:thioesterase family protein [Kibdelosporangium philippinense]|uniref:Thioesterase family protein n=1 Tax=Kibdelosporangium philippinense TaxID=211113 RepID=A0ABS8ZHL2_9PSEU|nr:thioesterase family protein [Kibdelosporangium philippinense]MCE7006849.1 thioesterase family protein [Kibdelosporangium philippinense]
MGSFKEATAVEKVGDGEFKADLDAQWSVGTKLHGGYLLAVLGRAAAELSEHPHLTAISGSFPMAPDPGPATVHVEFLQASRTLTQLRARLSQNGKPCVEALITQGTLTDNDPWWTNFQAPEMLAEQDCVRFAGKPPGATFEVPILDVVEARIDPSTTGWAMGEPTRTGSISTWQRLADGSDWDPLSLLVALDPVPPVSFELGAPGWAPTLQMSAYIRRLPAPGSVQVQLNASDVTNNRMDEAAFAWDSSGRVVAQANQFAAVRVPRG